MSRSRDGGEGSGQPSLRVADIPFIARFHIPAEQYMAMLRANQDAFTMFYESCDSYSSESVRILPDSSKVRVTGWADGLDVEHALTFPFIRNCWVDLAGMTHFIGDFMKLQPSGSHPRAARLGLNVLGVRWDRSTGLSTTVLFEEDSALILNISMVLEPFLVEIERADIEVRKSTLREAMRLDEEVLTTLHVASTLGYFQDPRKVSLQHIADQLGVSSNTVNRRIRKAERMLVASILK
jgi:hypothetical protein